MAAKIIAIEGADQTGKFTQACLLQEYLVTQGYKVALFEIPYDDGHTHKAIYSMLKNGDARKYPKIFQTLQCINKLIFQETKLRAICKQVDFVVLDRWSLSGLVYGAAEGVPAWYTKALFSSLVTPDCTIVLANAPHDKEVRDTYEKDSELQSKVRMLYQGMFEFDSHLQNAGRVSVIRSAGSPEEIHQRVLNHAIGEYYG